MPQSLHVIYVWSVDTQESQYIVYIYLILFSPACCSSACFPLAVRFHMSGFNEMLSDNTRQCDERRTKSDANVPVRLPSLITPKYTPGDPSFVPGDDNLSDPLPSLKDTGLLQQGRGVIPKGRSKSDPGKVRRFEYQGRLLKEYEVRHSDKNKKAIDIICVMQVPNGPEGNARFTRTNEAGRTITYELDVAQPPKQARACGNGPRCEFLSSLPCISAKE